LQDQCCDLIGYRYVCHHCELQKNARESEAKKINHTFNAWDSNVLSQLPKFVQHSFPFLLTSKSGILLSMLDHLCDDLVHGKGVEPAREAIEQGHITRFYTRQIQYYDLIRYHISSTAVYTSQERSILDDPPRFSQFDDSDGYNGFVPSAHYLETTWYRWCEERETLKDYDGQSWVRQTYLQRVQQTIDGCIWAGDASHKIAKLTIIRNPRTAVGHKRSENTTRPIYGIFTMFNEFEQVLWQQPMMTASLRELREELKLTILGRFIGHGFKLPIVYYTDECCDDRGMLQSIFDELREEGFPIRLDTRRVAPSDETSLPELCFPIGMEPACIVTDYHVSTACLSLREEMEKIGTFVLGLDCEWLVSFNSETKPPATIQLSTVSGKCFLFHIIRGNTKPRSLPKALEQLLEDDKIAKVGVGIKGDCTRLEKAYDVVITGVIDVVQFAAARKMEMAGRGLRDLVREFLLHDIPKDPKVRNSNWQAANLSKEQVAYACLDAYASVLAYMFVEENCDPIWRAAPSIEELLPEQRVLLYAKENMQCVGEGSIIAYTQERFGRYQLQTKYHNRRVVRVSKVFVPLARLPYRAEDKQETMKSAANACVLWDVNRMRLPSRGSMLSSVLSLPPEIHRQDDGGGSRSILETFTSPSDNEDFFSSSENNISPDNLVSIPGGMGDSFDSLVGEIDTLPRDEIEIEDGDDKDWTSDEENLEECNSTENTSPANDFSSPSLAVLLDVFHGMQRISRTIKLKHGAARAFFSRLRDAFFLVSKEDVETICALLHEQGLSPEEIDKMKNEDWVFFLRHCRRAVPAPKELLYRFDRVCSLFGSLEDSKTNEPLFRAETRKKIKSLRAHIEKGCLSDVPGIPLYYVTGKDNRSGLPTYRCVRGTNSVEGYHRHLRKLLAMYAGSPRLVHSILLEFNYRWNVRMAIKNRGLPEEIGGFYHQYILDHIREVTSAWHSTPLFPEWPSVRDFEDTQERFGLQQSKLTDGISSINNTEILLEDTEEELSLLQFERIPLPKLTPSAAHFAKLRGFKIPIAAITTTEEKKKFSDEWPKYIIGRSKDEVRHQSINFVSWAMDWNQFVEEMERGDRPLCAINRKNSHHLESYFKQYFSRSNAHTTLYPIRHEDEQLRRYLRESQPSTGHFMVSEPIAPIQLPPRHPPLPSIQPSQTSPPQTLPQLFPLQALPQPLPPQRLPQPLPPQTPPQWLPQPDSESAQGRPACRDHVCQICGHKRRAGHYRKFHTKTACNVLEIERRPPCFCDVHENRRKRQKQHYHVCDCQRCIE